MSTVTLSSDWAQYASNGYWLSNNVWNNGALQNGVDYVQTLTYNPATFPAYTTFSWAWPDTPNAAWAYSYPEIVYGATSNGYVPYGLSAPAPVQIANLNLSVTYSLAIAGNTKGFNVAFDLWLRSDTSTRFDAVTHEVMIWVHSNAGGPGVSPSFSLSKANGLASQVYVKPMSDASGQSQHTWSYIAAVVNNDQLSGKISISNVLKSLMWHKVISGHEYLAGIELGSEVTLGRGALAIKQLNYQWTASPTVSVATNSAPHLNGGVGHHVLGSGGRVDYAHHFADYRIKTSGGDLLIVAHGSISTLDMLDNVSTLHFADGVYDVSHSTFTPTSRNDVMSAASGRLTFVFGTHFGHDIINDFSVGDKIAFSHRTFHSFQQVEAHSHIDSNGDVVVAAGANDTITLSSIHHLSNLAPGEFLFL